MRMRPMSSTLKSPKQRAPLYSPTRAEIAAACQVIQQQWSPADRFGANAGKAMATIASVANRLQAILSRPIKHDGDELAA